MSDHVCPQLLANLHCEAKSKAQNACANQSSNLRKHNIVNMTSEPFISIKNAQVVLDDPAREASATQAANSTRTWFVPELEVAKGTKLGIAGPSGSGKSTLLNLLAGILRVPKGEVHVNRQPLAQLSGQQLDHYRGTTVGYLHQNLNLIDAVSAFENVAFAGRFAGISLTRSRELATSWLNAVGLQHRMNALPGKMSQGERQRAALARALMKSPSLVLADEPTSNLDSNSADMILKLLFEQASAHGTTLVIVSHDARVLEQCDRVERADQWITTS